MRHALPILAAIVLSACANTPGAPPSGGNDALIGAEWRLEDLLGGGIIDNSHVTMTLAEGGSAAGSGGCNRYFGSWARPSAGKLTLSQMGSSRMACAPALMDQEDRFLRALETAADYAFTPDGALVVGTAQGPLRFRKD
ncbi:MULTISPECIES: META domain-containing protein [Phenylobacterium]|uniref:Heat shock protein HslJ n=1 Tax=Phenylobacterium koreense TaxID=266125 RepID=A0ABV2EG67_9CAUL